MFDAIEHQMVTDVVTLLDEEPGLVECVGDHKALVRDKTPLMYALQCQALFIARELMKRGADVRARMPGGPGSSVLQLAVEFAGPTEKHHADMMQLVGELVDRGADPTEALWAACRAYTKTSPWRAKMIALLLARGADRDRPQGGSGDTTRTLVKVNAKRFAPEVLELFDQ